MEQPIPNEPTVTSGDAGDELPPATEPAGHLIPPPRKPPTAIAAFASEPEPRPPRPARGWASPARRPTLGGAVVRAIDSMLDVLDAVGDAVRATAGRVAR